MQIYCLSNAKTDVNALPVLVPRSNSYAPILTCCLSFVAALSSIAGSRLPLATGGFDFAGAQHPVSAASGALLVRDLRERLARAEAAAQAQALAPQLPATPALGSLGLGFGAALARLIFSVLSVTANYL